MLVITRRVGQSIVIPDCRIRIMLVRLFGGQAGLSFDIPDDLAVYREEVYQACQAGIVPFKQYPFNQNKKEK